MEQPLLIFPVSGSSKKTCSQKNPSKVQNFWDDPPGKKNAVRSWKWPLNLLIQLWNWWFSMAMFVYQRVTNPNLCQIYAKPGSGRTSTCSAKYDMCLAWNFREWSISSLVIIIPATPSPIHSLLSTSKFFFPKRSIYPNPSHCFCKHVPIHVDMVMAINVCGQFSPHLVVCFDFPGVGWKDSQKSSRARCGLLDLDLGLKQRWEEDLVMGIV